MANINSGKFYCNHAAIIATLKTSLNKVLIMLPCKVNMGSDGNIMPLYINKKLIPRATIEQ